MSTRQVESIWIDRFEFRGLHGCHSCCALRIQRLLDGRTLVICSELEDNPGTSITNAVEILGSVIVSHLALDPAKLVWVEHYPPGPVHGKKADWDLVTFGRLVHDGVRSIFADPSWRPMLADDWASMGLNPGDFVP